jgi:hypothetical protein
VILFHTAIKRNILTNETSKIGEHNGRRSGGEKNKKSL